MKKTFIIFVSFLLGSFFSSQSEAAGCATKPGEANKAAMSTAVKEAETNFAWDCLKSAASGFGTGAYDSTAGIVEGAASTAKSVLECAWSPLVCADRVATKVQNAVAFMGQLTSMISESFKNLTWEEAGYMACNLVGNLGATALAAIATGGMASARILEAITGTLAKLGSLGSSVIAAARALEIPFKSLAELSSETLDKVKALMQSGQGALVKDALISCGI